MLTGARLAGVFQVALMHAGKWHVGIKAAFELFPGPLKSRIKAERKKRFDEQHRAAVTAATSAASKSTKVHVGSHS